METYTSFDWCLLAVVFTASVAIVVGVLVSGVHRMLWAMARFVEDCQAFNFKNVVRNLDLAACDGGHACFTINITAHQAMRDDDDDDDGGEWSPYVETPDADRFPAPEFSDN